MGITYNEVIENELINKDVISKIPRVCECGSNIEFSENLKQAYCSNNQCFYKTAYKIVKVAKYLGLESITTTDAIAICKKYKLKSPFQLVMLDEIDFKDTKIKGDILRLKEKTFSLATLARLIMDEDIEKVAEKLFYGYNSVDEFYSDIDEFQLPLISERLGIETMEATALSVRIYNKLNEIREEMYFGETQLKIEKDTRKRLNIVIVGRMNKFVNNGEFIHLLRKKYSKYRLILMNTVTNTTDIVICDRDKSSNKIMIANKINEESVAKNIKIGALKIEDAGKESSGVYPLGYRIWISESDKIINKLGDV